MTTKKELTRRALAKKLDAKFRNLEQLSVNDPRRRKVISEIRKLKMQRSGTNANRFDCLFGRSSREIASSSSRT